MVSGVNCIGMITFLETAKKHGFTIDLSVKDHEGKTTFLFAVKMGNVPIEVIQSLITAENYNEPDDQGIPPIMYACALRRIDIIKLIIQKEADRLALDELDFDNLMQSQLARLTSFINQHDPNTGKSLAHFAIMRSGTDEDLKRPKRYQQTLMNLAKSVGIDGRRDENAKLNFPTDDDGNIIVLSDAEFEYLKDKKAAGLHRRVNLKKLGLSQDSNQFETITTPLAYSNAHYIPKAALATQKNSFILMSKTKGANAHIYQKLPDQIKSYAGVSFIESIMQRTRETIELLTKVGVDFSKQKNGNKTSAEYIHFLTEPRNRKSITKADIDNLFPLLDRLARLASDPPPSYSVQGAPGL